MTRLEKRDVLIKEWLKKAKEDIKVALHTGLEVEEKSQKNDLVTQMDRQVEEYFVKQIKKHFPDDLIVSEEGYGDDVTEEDFANSTVWFLDPIDGTLNFVLQNENYAIMLAVFEKGVGKQAYVYDVEKEKLYWTLKDKGVYCNDQLLPKMKDVALNDGLFSSNSIFLSDDQISFNGEITKGAMGVRTIGSAGLEVVELIKGNTVAYVSFGLRPWDIAPGIVLLQESGGVVTNFSGEAANLFKREPTIMGTSTAQKDIIKLSK